MVRKGDRNQPRSGSFVRSSLIGGLGQVQAKGDAYGQQCQDGGANQCLRLHDVSLRFVGFQRLGTSITWPQASRFKLALSPALSVCQVIVWSAADLRNTCALPPPSTSS